jgi:hypothetical protein
LQDCTMHGAVNLTFGVGDAIHDWNARAGVPACLSQG